MPFLFNTAGTANASIRLSTGAPDLSTRFAGFVWCGAVDRNGASEGDIPLFYVMGSDTSTTTRNLLHAVLLNSGQVRVGYGHTSIVSVDVDLDLDSLSVGTRVPVMIVGRIVENSGFAGNAAVRQLDVRAFRPGVEVSGTGFLFVTRGVTTGEWGFGVASTTPSFYRDTNRANGIEHHGLAIYTYGSTGHVPTLDTIEANCWPPSGGNIENVFEGSFWSTLGAAEAYLLCPGGLTNANPSSSFDGTGVGGPVTTSHLIASWPTINTSNAFYQNITTWTITGSHTIIDPFDAHPATLTPKTTTYSPNDPIVSGGRSTLFYSMLSGDFSRQWRVGTMGQSWSGGYPDGDNVAGNILWQGIIRSDLANAAGVLIEGIVDTDSTSVYSTRDSPRYGFTSASAEGCTNGTVVQLNGTAYGWTRFSIGGRLEATTANGITIAGGNVWVGNNANLTDQVFKTVFTRFGAITNSTPVTIGVIAAAYPNGPSVSYKAETCATFGGAAQTTFGPFVADLDTLQDESSAGFIGVAESFTVGSVSSAKKTSPDIIVVSGGTADDVDTDEIDAFKANPRTADHVWLAWNSTDDCAVITHAEFDEGTDEWTFEFDGGWAVARPGSVSLPDDIILIGRFRAVRLEVNGVIDAAPGTYPLVRFVATKTGDNGVTGPLRILARYAWGENINGFVIGGFGCGGTAYDENYFHTQPGFPDRLLRTMGADGVIVVNTSVVGGQGWFTTEIARMSDFNIEIMGCFVPVWMTPAVTIVPDQQDSGRSEFMAAFEAANLPVIDCADVLGSPTTHLLRGYRADPTHFSSRGYAAIWNLVKTTLGSLVQSTGGQGRGRARIRG